MKRLRDKDRCAAIITIGILVVGCATAAAPGQVPITTDSVSSAGAIALAEGSKDSPAITALGVLADNPLLRLAAKDAMDTLAWVESQKALLGPLKEFRARQCPTAIMLAVGDLREKVLALQGRMRTLEGRVTGGPTAPEMILSLTKLKFGDAPNPQAAIGQLRDDIANRIAAVTVSCAEIVPAKQLAELTQLAIRAGIITTPLAPLSGFLP